jgi:hypothetical protein
MCVLDICVVSVVSLELMTFFIVLKFWTGLGFIFKFAVYFQFFNGHFPVTTLGLDLFTGKHLNKLLFLWCPVTKNNSI